MYNISYFLTLIFTLLFFMKGYSQQIDLGDFKMEILEVVQKKSITSLGQIIFPHKKKQICRYKSDTNSYI